MNELQSQRPSDMLRPYVRAYAQRVVGADTAFQLLPPRLEPTIELNFGLPFEVSLEGRSLVTPPRAFIVGALSTVVQMRLPRGVESFVIFFRPGGVRQLFGIPIHHLSNDTAEARAVLGISVNVVWEAMASATSFASRVAIIEEFLGNRVAGASTPLMAAAANDLFRHHGMPRIASMAAHYGLGVRQFERRFAIETGLSPKTFARIARLQTAIDRKQAHPQTTWCDIAHALGYHDQMHLIHDCSKLGGEAPTRIIDALGDSRPPALLAGEQL